MTKTKLLKYARQCLATNPKISDRELQAELESFYLQSAGDKTMLRQLMSLQFPGVAVGAVLTPLDWLLGAARILPAAAKIIATRKIDGQSVSEIIQGVIIIARKDNEDEDKKQQRKSA